MSGTTVMAGTDMCLPERHVLRFTQTTWTSSEPEIWQPPDECVCGEFYFVGYKGGNAVFRSSSGVFA